jgi:signal peptidase I
LPDTTVPPVAVKRSKLAIVAAVVALLMVFLILLSGFREPVGALCKAAFVLVGAIGVLQRQVWAAYSLALLQLFQAMLGLLLLKDGGPVVPLIGACVGSLLFCLLFLLAARALERSSGARGNAVPWVVVACLFTVPFVFLRAYVMPTGSMENSLLIGDDLLVRVFPRPAVGRDDLVVFHYPIDRTNTFVKRVIGVPGDRIRMVAKVVYRNGSKVNEPYVIHQFPEQDSMRDDVPGPAGRTEPTYLDAALQEAGDDMLLHHVVNGEVVVPAGKYFVLGDNRDNSLDSRYWGFVGEADLIGKPVLIYDSVETTDTQFKGNTPLFSVPHVRWNRLFKVL